MPTGRALLVAAAAAAAACSGGGAPETAAWTPAPDAAWTWQLTGTLDLSVPAQVYDVDLFEAPDSALAALDAAGRQVVCYFSAGSDEDWRPDHGAFTPADVGSPVDGWPGERWLDTRSVNVRDVLRGRLALAAQRGCDGVEPDNVDGYQNAPGFPLTAATQLDFNRFLAREAHRLGLAIALKNDVDQVAALADDFDFALNEQCHEYDECGVYAAFTSRGKAVWNAEYAEAYRLDADGARGRLCTSARGAGLRTLVLPVDLDGSFRFTCD